MKETINNELKELRKSGGFDKLSNYERKETLKEIFVISPKIKLLNQSIDECRVTSKFMPASKCMCIYGEPGTGKTYLVENYVKLHPAFEKEYSNKIQKIVPVLYTKVPPKASGLNISNSIRQSLGDPFYNIGKNTDEKIRNTIAKIKDCEVELVILDEVQHIIDRDSDKVIREAADWIKVLIEETKIPFIFVGLKDMLNIMKANEQLESRFKERKEIEYFSISNSEGLKDFRTFLHVIDMKLPLPERSMLADEKVAVLLYEGSEGNLRVLMEHIIIPATVKAIDLSLKKLSYAFLENEIKRMLNTQVIQSFERDTGKI